MDPAHSINIMSGSDAEDLAAALVPTLPIEKQDNAASLWAKRMRILDMLADAVSMLRSPNDGVRGEAEEVVAQVTAANPIGVSPWWDYKCDIAMITGVYDHGYGNYEPIKVDERYREVFAPTREAGPGGAPAAVFPPADTLTRRLKRMVDHLVRLKVRLGLPCEVPDPPPPDECIGLKPTGKEAVVDKQKPKWSKKEMNELLRVLMSYGFVAPVPLTLLPCGDQEEGGGGGEGAPQRLGVPEGCAACWESIFTRLRDRARLESKSVEEVEEAIEAIVSEALHYATGTDSNAMRVKDVFKSPVVRSFLLTRSPSCATKVSEVCWDNAHRTRGTIEMEVALNQSMPRVLTPTSAIKVLERLELVETYLGVLGSGPSDSWDDLGLSKPSTNNELPVWWRTGHHDRMMVLSVLRYGLGKFDFLHDQLFEEIQRGRAAAGGGPKPEVQGAAPAAPAGVDEGVLPKSVDEVADIITVKTGFRRLRYLNTVFKRVLRKRNVAALGLWRKSLEAYMANGQKDEEVVERKDSKKAPPRRQFKATRASLIKRDESGAPLLPMSITEKLELVALGEIVYDRPGFHNERHLFPVGFKSRREHASLIDPNGRTTYTNEILDNGGAGAVFRVTPDDAPDRFEEHDSASGAWVALEKKVLESRSIKREKVTVRGTEMFGFSHPTISMLIQELENVDKCPKFNASLSFYQKPALLGHPASGEHEAPDGAPEEREEEEDEEEAAAPAPMAE